MCRFLNCLLAQSIYCVIIAIMEKNKATQKKEESKKKEKTVVTMDKLIALCKQRGFVFPGSEIYGGLANSWDYGPLGCELKDNIRAQWWKYFVQESENSVGLDSGIFMNPQVWHASGHVGGFNDPLMDCKSCKMRHRADTLINNYRIKEKTAEKDGLIVDAMSNEEMEKYVADKKIVCPHCGKSDFTKVRQFNLMFKTHRGVVEDSSSIVYLRPETAQGQYVNFLNVQRSMRLKVPFGIAQVGKAFRNEITPGNFIFRTIEFEQMEHQLFCKSEDSASQYKFYKKHLMNFYIERLGFCPDNLRYHNHEKLAFYAKAACDIDYNFCFGWNELSGTHNRSDYDLTQHAKFSGKTQEYMDPVTNEKFTPCVVESSQGLTRLFLATLHEAYNEEILDDGETRIVLKLKPSIAPYKVAVLPLQKKDLTDKSKEIYKLLSKQMMATYDDTASIGKRYRRQDEIGTPFCVTVDYDTLKDNCVTVRDRDTMKQERIAISALTEYIKSKI